MIPEESPRRSYERDPYGIPRTWQRLWQGPESNGEGRNCIPQQKRFWRCGSR
jgi:hypothetical protein